MVWSVRSVRERSNLCAWCGRRLAMCAAEEEAEEWRDEMATAAHPSVPLVRYVGAASIVFGTSSPPTEIVGVVPIASADAGMSDNVAEAVLPKHVQSKG
eukprot:SAG11_NODE_2255_length_3620_cov_1.538483_4_plen_99_part_00